MYSNFTTNQSIIPKAYNCQTLEGNWYEDRSTSQFNYQKKKNYQLRNPNEWQYQTSNDNFGSFNKEYPSLQNKFLQSNDNYINFQKPKQEMYISTYKHSYDAKYAPSFKVEKKSTDYYLNKKEELQSYRETWTKKNQLFDTTYNDDLLKTFMVKKK